MIHDNVTPYLPSSPMSQPAGVSGTPGMSNPVVDPAGQQAYVDFASNAGYTMDDVAQFGWADADYAAMAVPFGMDGNPYGAIDEVTGLPKEEGPVGIYTPEDIISHPSLPGIPGMPGGIRPMPLLTAEQLEALTRPQNVIDESYYQGQIDENTMQVMLAQQQAYTDFYYENEQEQDTEPDWLRELDLSMGAPVNPQKIEAASELVQDLLKGVVISEADAQRVLEMYSSLTPEEMASLGPMMNIIDSIAQTANQQYYGNVYEGEDIYLSNDESDWI